MALLTGPFEDAGSEIPDGAKGWKRFRGLRKFQRIIERVPDQGVASEVAERWQRVLEGCTNRRTGFNRFREFYSVF